MQDIGSDLEQTDLGNYAGKGRQAVNVELSRLGAGLGLIFPTNDVRQHLAIFA